MAAIQTYDGPKVREGSLNSGLMSTPDAGAGLEAVAAGAGTVSDMLQKGVEREAQDQAWQIEAALTSEWQQQRAGLRQQYKGNSVDAYAEGATTWWKEAPAKYGANLSPAVRRMIGPRLAQLQLSAQQDTLGYVAGEKTKSRQINYETANANDLSATNAQLTPETAIAQTTALRQRIIERAVEHANSEGYDSEVAMSMARDALKGVHAANISSVLDGGDVAAAKQYIAKFGGEMDPGTRAQAEHGVHIAEIDQTSRDAMLRTSNMDYSQRIEYVKQHVKDPAALKQAMALVREDEAMKQQQRQLNEQAASRELSQYIASGKLAPVSLLSRLDPGAVMQYRNYQHAQTVAAATGTPRKTDPDAFAKILQLATNDPASFARIPLTELAPALSTEDIARVQGMQAKIQHPDSGIATALQQVAAVTTDFSPAAKGMFTRAAMDAIATETRLKGRELDYKERQQLLDVLTYDNHQWTGADKLYEVESGDRAQWVEDTVPAADRDAIVKSLRAIGVDPSAENIYRMYVQGKQQGG